MSKLESPYIFGIDFPTRLLDDFASALMTFLIWLLFCFRQFISLQIRYLFDLIHVPSQTFAIEPLIGRCTEVFSERRTSRHCQTYLFSSISITLFHTVKRSSVLTQPILQRTRNSIFFPLLRCARTSLSLKTDILKCESGIGIGVLQQNTRDKGIG